MFLWAYAMCLLPPIAVEKKPNKYKRWRKVKQCLTRLTDWPITIINKICCSILWLFKTGKILWQSLKSMRGRTQVCWHGLRIIVLNEVTCQPGTSFSEATCQPEAVVSVKQHVNLGL